MSFLSFIVFNGEKQGNGALLSCQHRLSPECPDHDFISIEDLKLLHHASVLLESGQPALGVPSGRHRLGPDLCLNAFDQTAHDQRLILAPVVSFRNTKLVDARFPCSGLKKRRRRSPHSRLP
ncbi:hypothetical protein MLD38_038638 [Melastoma candidum]|uniref:Uncharacterized protein n=1 Tax=Melastoma candidum TaxID=119954 RepID=A0ACB9KZJ4_9MYRT|nr:hypothetical protein MLD38_038638 [Melastoma candidum]